jgi:hypothetical protein
MTQDAAPIGHEEEISVSKDTVISDEWPSRPADWRQLAPINFGFRDNGAFCKKYRIPNGLC